LSKASRFETVVMKVRTTVHRRMILMVRPLDEPIPPPTPKGDFAFHEMTGDTKEAYLQMLPGRRTVVDERLRRGARCFLAWDGDHLAHGYWIGSNRVLIDYMEGDLVLAPRDLYMYDSYSPPAYRGRGLAQAMGLHVMRLAWEEGYERAWCLPAVENRAGTRPVEAIGYRSVSTLHYLRLGWFRRYWSVPPVDASQPQLVR